MIISIKVLLPLPVAPIIPIKLPLEISRSMPSNIVRPSSEYLNFKFSILILFLKEISLLEDLNKFSFEGSSSNSNTSEREAYPALKEEKLE